MHQRYRQSQTDSRSTESGFVVQKNRLEVIGVRGRYGHCSVWDMLMPLKKEKKQQLWCGAPGLVAVANPEGHISGDVLHPALLKGRCGIERK